MTAATGVRDGRSLGIARYVARLAEALRELGVAYTPAEAPVPHPGGRGHRGAPAGPNSLCSSSR